MKIKTTTDLYVGRYFYDNFNGKKVAHFNAIIPTGMSEPFKIPEGTEVQTIEGTDFNSLEDLYNNLEEGMFKFVFEDEAQEVLFEMLIECANVVNYDDSSFYDCTGVPIKFNS